MAISPQRLTIYLYSAVVFAIAQLSCVKLYVLYWTSLSRVQYQQRVIVTMVKYCQTVSTVLNSSITNDLECHSFDSYYSCVKPCKLSFLLVYVASVSVYFMSMQFANAHWVKRIIVVSAHVSAEIPECSWLIVWICIGGRTARRGSARAPNFQLTGALLL